MASWWDERFDWTTFNVDPLPKCTATDFYRDDMNLTAAQIGGDVTGTLDATTCNIGAYNPTSVDDADIFGANYFGVVATGVATNVTDSSIHSPTAGEIAQQLGIRPRSLLRLTGQCWFAA